MGFRLALEMSGVELVVPPGDGRPLGTRVLAGLTAMAEGAIDGLAAASGGRPMGAVGRVRGTGRGVSVGRLFESIEEDHPLDLRAPFEGSELVSGGVWHADLWLEHRSEAAVAKLRWDCGAADLPMHTHEHSDRFIVVAQGRGYFHVTDEPVDQFTGERVRTVPARERDAFVFTRGLVHTFSTDHTPMVLLSCQLPHLPFDAPGQYRLPDVHWTAASHREDVGASVACDPAWTVLAGACQVGRTT